MNGSIRQYPLLEIDLDKLKDNLAALVERCRIASIEIAGVVKGFTALPEVAKIYTECGIRTLASSRTEQLRALRDAHIDCERFLIRVPMLSELREVAELADLSLASDVTVLRALNAECARQDRRHRVILMLDLGDLREGFYDCGELTAAALEVERELPSLELAGVGTNLGCYGSVAATPEKMDELTAAAEAVERAIGRRLPFISGGASTSVHMVLDGTMPPRVNQLRIGEFALFGGIFGCYPDFMHRDVFTLRMEVVECRDKPSYPRGELTVDAFGKTRTYVDRGIRRRALCAAGRVDYGDPSDLRPRLAGVEVLGASSDHTILDVEDAGDAVTTGSVLDFDVSYGSVVYLTNTESVRVVCRRGGVSYNAHGCGASV